MTRAIRMAVALIIGLAVTACQGATTASVTEPAASATWMPAHTEPAASATPPPEATASAAAVPAGRILFHRLEDGREAYFTVNPDGSGESALFTTEGCGCARLSPDGRQVWTMGATGHGTYSFRTMDLDGGHATVAHPPIETLNLGPAAPSRDGRWIAFAGWDETDPSRDGLYLTSSTDLSDLRFVTPLPDGTIGIEPFAVTPGGSHVLFFADTGQAEHHEGDIYVVNSNGSGLRRLNPPGTTHSWLGIAAGSLSPDGATVAFGVNDAVFVADIEGGEPRRITETTGFVWAVSWSPAGDWITYTHQHGTQSVISLVRPDGSADRELSPKDGSEVAGGVWSPDGDALLVQRRQRDGSDLWIMNLEGTFLAQVTHRLSTFGAYEFGPP